ncbi:MAG: hypothetical protein DYG98_14225 [Haliscomenobacteraceae bacterium CHB4]|nr:hypothetical protein [Saprospiraceae bacterium]MCE7924199.1 hypothetical protein [Haliscomenobacteraceae bacterium CHB4]
MNYRNMIEPYLYGNLSPEDEVAFERQLSRDPALAEEASRRLNAEETLSGMPEYHARKNRPSSGRVILLAGLLATLLVLMGGKCAL